MNYVTATGAVLKAMAYSREVSDNLHLPNDNGGEGFVKSFTDDETTEEPPRKLEDEEYLDADKFVTVQKTNFSFEFLFSNNFALNTSTTGKPIYTHRVLARLCLAPC